MDPVTVIDIGTTKVVCLHASLAEDGRLRVDGVAEVGCRGVAKGAVQSVDPVAEAIDEAVARVERSTGKSIEDVAVGVSGAHLQSVNAQGYVPIYPNTRQIRRDDLMAVVNHSRQVVMPTDREQIMAVPREFRVDGQRGVQRPLGMTGGRLEVVTHIVTGKSSALDAIDQAVTRAGRRVSEMVAQPVASGLGAAPPEALESGCVVVDIGAGATQVAVFESGAVQFTACLPVGGAHVTSDLQALLKLSPDEAERLKLLFGAALSRAAKEDEVIRVKQQDQNEERPMQRRVLCEIVESRMREVASLVTRQIDASGCSCDLPGGVFLTGGASMLPAIGTLFGEALGCKSIHMAYPKVAGPNARLAEAPTMSAAVGIAKYCLEGDEHEFAPVSGSSNWKDKIRTLKNPFVKKG